MSATGSDTDKSGLSLRNVVLAVSLLLVVRLGTGWARGLAEGEYLIGILGVVLVLGPVVWLVSQFKTTYF